jgi:hypothetical protein
MVFLMMNTWFSKNVEDTKSWIKILIGKVCILFVNPYKDEAQTALFKDPVRTAL